MPKNKSEDLNNLLFETMEMLRDGDIEIEKAEAIANVAQVIVNNTKNEIAYLNTVGGMANGSGFFSANNNDPKLLNQ